MIKKELYTSAYSSLSVVYKPVGQKNLRFFEIFA